jgi:hypothetical protein
MKEEEEDKIWSRLPKGGPIPRLTGRLSAARRTPTPTVNYRLVLPSERALQNNKR